MDDAQVQHLAGEGHPLGKSTRIAGADAQEVQAVAEIVEPTAAVVARAAVDVRCHGQPVSYGVIPDPRSRGDDGARDLVARDDPR